MNLDQELASFLGENPYQAPQTSLGPPKAISPGPVALSPQMLQVAQGLKLLLISLALSFVVGLIAGVFSAWIKTVRHQTPLI